MKVICLGASSKGNCFHVEFDSGKQVIFDAGVSPRLLIDQRISMSDALVLVTHEHGDHIKFADEMRDKYSSRIAVSKGTEKYIKQADYILEANVGVKIDGLKIIPFTVIHNAENPVGYYVSDESESVIYVTDAGMTPAHIVDDVDVLIIEANYTKNALENRSLLAHVVGRISSGFGHLSVDEAFEYADYYLDRLDLLLLTHVSMSNFCHIEYHGSDKISKEFKEKAIIAEAGKEYLSLPF